MLSHTTDSFKLMQQIPQSYMVTDIGDVCEGSSFSVTWTSFTGNISKLDYNKGQIVSVLKPENIGTYEVLCKEMGSKHTYQIQYRACK